MRLIKKITLDGKEITPKSVEIYYGGKLLDENKFRKFYVEYYKEKYYLKEKQIKERYGSITAFAKICGISRQYLTVIRDNGIYENNKSFEILDSYGVLIKETDY